jgi:small-conductance mechanosensitive channel
MTHDQIQAYLNLQVFRQNTVRDLGESAIIFVLSMLLLWFVKVWVVGILKKAAAKTSTVIDDILIDGFDRSVLPILYAAAFYFAFYHLDLSKGADRFLAGAFKAVLIFQAVRLLLDITSFFIRNSWIKSESAGSFASKSILTILKVLIWGVAILFLLDNLGFDVNAVVAGLGIGGVAVALAAQTILGDLFNYFVIVFDQPFVDGDFIVVDEFMGEIEKIGIKSTRIRSLGGDLLIVSNSNLMASRIRNFKRMEKRRIVFTFGVVYQTPPDKLERIPGMVRQIIEGISKTKFDRSHFKAYGDSSLDFETVYFVLDRDYNIYMDIQHAVNIAIMKLFLDEGIGFAYPTRTLYHVAESPSQKLVKN